MSSESSHKKRGASHYLTKDHGSTVNPGQDEDTPKMATPAQLARRRLTPKSRLGRSVGAGGTQNGLSNPQQQQIFPGANGAVTFGASQSFPPNNSSSGAFTFEVPKSNSFTFGDSTTAPNPFAGINGVDTGEKRSQAEEDMMDSSPQKKPAFGTGFGSNGNNTGGSGFQFGQTSQQGAGGFSFGSTQNNGANTNSAPLFGGPVQQPSTNNEKSLFGQSASSQPLFGGFGQKTPSQNEASTQAPTFQFGQTATTAEQPSSGFKFGGADTSTSKPNGAFGDTSGQNTTHTPAFGSAFDSTQASSTSGNEKPLFSFGTGPSTSQSQAAGFSFGQKESVTPQSGANLFKFGKPSTAEPANAEPKPDSEKHGVEVTKTPFAFGQTQGATPAKTSFGGFGSSKSEETKPTPALFGQPPAASSQGSGSFFGQSSSAQISSVDPNSKETPSAPSNPFAGLFGQTKSAAAPTPSASTETPNSVFKFAAPTAPTNVDFGRSTPKSSAFQMNTSAVPPTSSPFKPSGSLFSAKDNAESSSTATGKFADEATTSTVPPPSQNKPLFGFTPSQTPSSGGLFSPAKTSSESAVQSSRPGDTSNAPSSASAFSNPPITTSTSLSTSSTTAQASKADNLSASTNPRSALFSPASSSVPTSGLFSNESESSLTTGNQPNPKRPIYTKSPARIPQFLNGDGYKEYDNNHRLHSLNREFQRRIAKLDPQQHDFENIVRHYVAARESIGASIGLYLRNVAGMKRKMDDPEENEDIPNQYKRAKPAEPQNPSLSEPSKKSVALDNASIPQSTTSSIKVSETTPSKSTSIFKSMIPDAGNPQPSASNTVSPFKPSGNPFASVKPTTAPSFGLFGGNNSSALDTSPTKASTTPSKSPPKKPAFEMPKFGGGQTNFMAAFGAKAKESAAKLERDAKEKRKAEDFDSDEDDAEEWEKQYEEEQRQKRAKVESVTKGGFVPAFGDSKVSTTSTSLFKFSPSPATNSVSPQPEQSQTSGSSKSSSEAVSEKEDDDDDDEDETDEADNAADGDFEPEEDEEEEDDLPEDEILEEGGDEDSDGDLQAAMARSKNNPNKGKSLFDRVEPNPGLKKDIFVNGDKKDVEEASTENAGSPIMQSATNSAFKPNLWGSHIGTSTPEAPSFSPLTPATNPNSSKEPYKPATTFNFIATPPSGTSTPVPGASIFAGGLTKGGPVPGEGMFGSRPGTPSNADKPATNVFAGLSKTNTSNGSDHTWKIGSEIKFGTPEKAKDAPTVNITAPSPNASNDTNPNAFSSLFGNASSTPASSNGSNSLGFSFGSPSSAPAPGFLGAASHLVGSANSSAISSRATSPGLTDTESVATNDTEESSHDPQTSLMDSRSGEENEDCLFEARSKALKFVNEEAAKGTKLKPNDWNTVGVGVLRVLKDKKSGKTRIVLRAEPGASIVVNALLLPSMTYEAVDQGKSGAVKGGLVHSGKLERWVFKLKTKEMADEMSKYLEENKGN